VQLTLRVRETAKSKSMRLAGKREFLLIHALIRDGGRRMADLQDKTGTLSEEKNFSFCFTLTSGGTQSKRSRNFEDFIPLMEQASIAWVDVKLDDFEKEAVETGVKFGFSELLIKQLLTRLGDGTRFQGGYEDYDTEMGLLLPAISAKSFDITINPVLMLLKKNLITTIRSNKTHVYRNLHRYAEAFLRRLPRDLKQTDLLTLLLIRLLDENNERNFEQLQEIDKWSEGLTRDLKDESIVRSAVGDQIYQIKLTLVRYLSCLWGTSDTLNSLRYGDADLVSDDPQVLDKISLLIREVRDQLSLAEHLSDVLASGLECLQSIHNNQLQERNNLLQDRNNVLQGKNNKLADLNNKLQEKNNLLQEKNNKMQEYSNRLTLLNNRLTVLNNRITLLAGFLAILSAGFIVPNTIATVMSQTNIFVFSPADMGWYLALIVGSTIFTTMLVWFWVKKKGLLPKTAEENEERLISEAEKEREIE
jgi:magnesium transporter